MSGLFGGSDTTNLEPMLTPEQQQAMAALLQFGQTGQLGDFTAGEAYGGDLGYYTPTNTENLTQSRLFDMISAGLPSYYQTAENTLSNLANTEFNPDDPSSGFAAYKRQVARATKDADDVIDREAAITGSRYGDRILGEKTDLAAQQSDILSTKLADLYNTSQNRALAGAQGLTNLGTASQNILSNQMQLGSQYGSLGRLLKNQELLDKYNEWQRQRSERLGSIGALSGVMNKNVDYGIKSLTTEGQSPWGDLLSSVLGGVGTAMGGPIGGMIGSGISNLGSYLSSGIGSLFDYGGLFGPSQSSILGFDTSQYS